MKDTKQHLRKRRANTHRLIFALMLLSTVSAGAYTVAESKALGPVDDDIFIGLLISATVFLGFAILFLQWRFKEALEGVLTHRIENTEGTPLAPIDLSRDGAWISLRRFLVGGASTSAELADLLYHIPSLCVSALVYGVAISSSVFVLDIHSTELLPRLTLVSFLFCVNALTGVGIYTILIVLIQCWHAGSYVPVSQPTGKTIEMRDYERFLTTATVVSAIYIGACQTSVLFSHYSFGGWIYGYAVFAFLLLLAIYLVPQQPLRAKLRRENRPQLDKIQKSRATLGARIGESGVAAAYDDLEKQEQSILKVRIGPSLGPSRRGTLIAVCSAVLGAAAPHLPEAFSWLSQVGLVP